jgi:uncharacterized membrane protein
VTPTAIILIGVSAFAHALWNLLGRRERSSLAFFLLANTLGWMLLLPVLLVAGRIVPLALAAAWPYLAATGASQALYYAALSAAYRDGELSLVYPVVRSAGVVLVTLAGLAAGRGGGPGTLATIGIVLVVAGIFLLPHARFRDIGFAELRSRGVAFALLAAVGTAGYSLADDRALRLLRPALAPQSATVTAVLYSLLEGAVTSGMLAAVLGVGAILRRPRGLRGATPTLAPSGRPGAVRFGPAALAGAAMFGGYTLVLVAMGFARTITYVVAFRQASVPIGVLLGLAVLGERLSAPKAVGVLAVTAGLVLVAVG